ncbi:hypothetical protein [Mycobacterium sp. DL440]|uniref:hypothetical protein n=1 Tax=Mycobacterium sp. DL440 TaxID=2675523 RepID=UPI0014204DCC|nr:hypothetical protein [Mycobacterium sp. DL440]
MTSAPDDQLALAAAAVREAESLKRQLNTARSHTEESTARARAAEGRLQTEARDVHKLESLSLTKIWSQLKGSHEDDVARETAEHLTGRLAALGDVGFGMERALTAKERWVQDNDGPGVARLLEIAELRGQLTAEINELVEASSAGQRALKELRTAAAQLDSARSWSAYDTWFDGGLIASVVKQDRLDAVAMSLRSADADLKRFSTELADVHMEGARLVELDSFTRVFDVWFDNFFTDFAVRERIIGAQEKADQAIAGVKRTLTDLDQRTKGCTREFNRLTAERADLLVP